MPSALALGKSFPKGRRASRKAAALIGDRVASAAKPPELGTRHEVSKSRDFKRLVSFLNFSMN